MSYFLSFLEGMVTFLSPCLLPLLPVYVSYFAGGTEVASPRRQALVNALGFVLGFTLVFVLMGAAAGTFGRAFGRHRLLLERICGAFLLLIGLQFLGVFRLGPLGRTYRLRAKLSSLRFVTSVAFGVIFAVGWTPCVGAFLSSALMLAASTQHTGRGVLMLLLFSMGLGVPFVLSAVLIDSLKRTFDTVKRHYQAIHRVCGLLFLLVGGFLLLGRGNVFAALPSLF